MYKLIDILTFVGETLGDFDGDEVASMGWKVKKKVQV